MALDNYNSSINRGYFRNEVYRFAVVYTDGESWSEPSPIDFSNISVNRASSYTDNEGNTFADFKFPSRQEQGFKLFNEDGDIKSLGLSLKGLTNHPTWAKALAIVRLKRKKNILFQTPVIPAQIVEPAIATGEYPSEGNELPDPTGTYVPKNMFQWLTKDIARRTNSDAFPDLATNGGYVIYEQRSGIEDSPYVSFIYPPELMMNSIGRNYMDFSDNGSLKFNVVDFAALKQEGEGFDSFELDNDKARISSVFYADNKGSYYFNEDVPAQTFPTITGYGEDSRYCSVRELGVYDGTEKVTPSSSSLGDKRPNVSSLQDYDSLNLSKDVEGFPAKIQKFAYVVTSEKRPDLSYFSLDSSVLPWTSSTPDHDAIQFQAGSIPTDKVPALHSNDIPSLGGYNVTNVVEIANIEAGLDDNRYSGSDSYDSYIFTGAFRVLSDSEVENNTPIDIDVWGGDCFISQFSFKTTDTVYSLVNPDFTETEETDTFGATFYNTNNSNNVNVKRPFPVSGASQIVSVMLESEVNAWEANEFSHNLYTGESARTPEGSGDVRIPLSYSYSSNYSLQNDQKIFAYSKDFEDDRTLFPSRVVHSAQKIYQTNVIGFDEFRVLNFKDLDESMGGISKLTESQGRMFSIQESGIAYIPIQVRLLEQGDGDTISVNSGDILGNHVYINKTYGTPLYNGVVSTPDGFVILDPYNSKLIQFNNGTGSSVLENNGLVSDLNEIFLQEGLDLTDERKVQLGYDTIREELWISTNYSSPFSDIYNFKINKWTGGMTNTGNHLRFSDSRFGLHLAGSNEDGDILIGELKKGAYGDVFGTVNDSKLEFIINPTPDNVIVIDNMVINSNRGNESIVLSVPVNESGLTMTTSEMSAIPNIEGNYRLKVLRNITPINGRTGQRMRGRYGICDITIDNQGNVDNKLYSVMTTYRPSTPIIS